MFHVSLFLPYFKSKFIPLTEKIEKVITIEKGVHLILNDIILYKIDVGNKYNRLGNAEFKKNDFEKAVKYYSIAFNRYPKSIKVLFYNFYLNNPIFVIVLY